MSIPHLLEDFPSKNQMKELQELIRNELQPVLENLNQLQDDVDDIKDRLNSLNTVPQIGKGSYRTIKPVVDSESGTSSRKHINKNLVLALGKAISKKSKPQNQINTSICQVEQIVNEADNLLADEPAKFTTIGPAVPDSSTDFTPKRVSDFGLNRNVQLMDMISGGETTSTNRTKFSFSKKITPKLNNVPSRSSLSRNRDLSSQSRVERGVKSAQLITPSTLITQCTIEHLRVADKGTCHRYSIRHDGTAKHVWDIAIMLLVLCEVILTPLTLSFYENSSYIYFDHLSDSAFILDLFINMLCSFENNDGAFISHPKKTVVHYIFGPWFLVDFLSCFPFKLLADGNNTSVLQGLKILRLIRLSKLAKNINSLAKAGAFRLVRLLGVIFIISHWAACLWGYFAKGWQMLIPSWEVKSITEKYILCLYTMVSCLLTSPPPTTTIAEHSISGLCIITGAVVQASVFGSVAVLISSFDEGETQFQKKLILIYQRCTFLGLPEKVKQRIQLFYTMLWKQTHSMTENGDSFIYELSPSLICEIKFHMFKDMVKNIPFLTSASSLIVESLVLKLSTVTYLQDDLVMRRGEYGDWMAFIGKKGYVSILDSSHEEKRIIRILGSGEYIGEMSVLYRTKRSADVVALTWVQMHVLSRDDFEDVKCQYPAESVLLEEEMQKFIKQKKYINTNFD